MLTGWSLGRQAVDQRRHLQDPGERVYVGGAVHKGVAYPGEHAAIIDQRTWDKAHAVMAEPAHRRGAARGPRYLPS
jgi:site-specific DNA recombinase